MQSESYNHAKSTLLDGVQNSYRKQASMMCDPLQISQVYLSFICEIQRYTHYSAGNTGFKSKTKKLELALNEYFVGVFYNCTGDLPQK